MTCFRPLEAFQLETGEIKFVERGKVLRALHLPCGRCIGCRMARRRAWATRCMHENQMHHSSVFVTLTYDDANCPISLDYRDFQRFMYRLRSWAGAVRFYACGEYGDLSRRPHFHAILFGVSFDDGVPCGDQIYSSGRLSKLWPHGFASFGNVTYESAGYVAGYVLKKRLGKDAEDHYRFIDWRSGELVQVRPEFARMSLKPGIGYTWFQKYWRDVYGARDGIVLPGGKVIPPPKYYDKLLMDSQSDDAEHLQFLRYQRAEQFAHDCTPERLATREVVALAGAKFRSQAI